MHQPGGRIQYDDSLQIQDNDCLCHYRYTQIFRIFAYLKPAQIEVYKEGNKGETEKVQGYKWELDPKGYQYAFCDNSRDLQLGVWRQFYPTNKNIKNTPCPSYKLDETASTPIRVMYVSNHQPCGSTDFKQLPADTNPHIGTVVKYEIRRLSQDKPWDDWSRKAIYYNVNINNYPKYWATSCTQCYGYSFYQSDVDKDQFEPPEKPSVNTGGYGYASYRRVHGVWVPSYPSSFCYPLNYAINTFKPQNNTSVKTGYDYSGSSINQNRSYWSPYCDHVTKYFNYTLSDDQDTRWRLSLSNLPDVDQYFSTDRCDVYKRDTTQSKPGTQPCLLPDPPASVYKSLPLSDQIVVYHYVFVKKQTKDHIDIYSTEDQGSVYKKFTPDQFIKAKVTINGKSQLLSSVLNKPYKYNNTYYVYSLDQQLQYTKQITSPDCLVFFYIQLACSCPYQHYKSELLTQAQKNKRVLVVDAGSYHWNKLVITKQQYQQNRKSYADYLSSSNYKNNRFFGDNLNKWIAADIRGIQRGTPNQFRYYIKGQLQQQYHCQKFPQLPTTGRAVIVTVTANYSSTCKKSYRDGCYCKYSSSQVKYNVTKRTQTYSLCVDADKQKNLGLELRHQGFQSQDSYFVKQGVTSYTHQFIYDYGLNPQQPPADYLKDYKDYTLDGCYTFRVKGGSKCSGGTCSDCGDGGSGGPGPLPPPPDPKPDPKPQSDWCCQWVYTLRYGQIPGSVCKSGSWMHHTRTLCSNLSGQGWRTLNCSTLSAQYVKNTFWNHGNPVQPSDPGDPPQQPYALWRVIRTYFVRYGNVEAKDQWLYTGLTCTQRNQWNTLDCASQHTGWVTTDMCNKTNPPSLPSGTPEMPKAGFQCTRTYYYDQAKGCVQHKDVWSQVQTFVCTENNAAWTPGTCAVTHKLTVIDRKKPDNPDSVARNSAQPPKPVFNVTVNWYIKQTQADSWVVDHSISAISFAQLSCKTLTQQKPACSASFSTFQVQTDGCKPSKDSISVPASAYPYLQLLGTAYLDRGNCSEPVFNWEGPTLTCQKESYWQAPGNPQCTVYQASCVYRQQGSITKPQSYLPKNDRPYQPKWSRVLWIFHYQGRDPDDNCKILGAWEDMGFYQDCGDFQQGWNSDQCDDIPGLAYSKLMSCDEQPQDNPAPPYSMYYAFQRTITWSVQQLNQCYAPKATVSKWRKLQKVCRPDRQKEGFTPRKCALQHIETVYLNQCQYSWFGQESQPEDDFDQDTFPYTPYVHLSAQIQFPSDQLYTIGNVTAQLTCSDKYKTMHINNIPVTQYNQCIDAASATIDKTAQSLLCIDSITVPSVIIPKFVYRATFQAPDDLQACKDNQLGCACATGTAQAPLQFYERACDVPQQTEADKDSQDPPYGKCTYCQSAITKYYAYDHPLTPQDEDLVQQTLLFKVPQDKTKWCTAYVVTTWVWSPVSCQWCQPTTTVVRQPNRVMSSSWDGWTMRCSGNYCQQYINVGYDDQALQQIKKTYRLGPPPPKQEQCANCRKSGCSVSQTADCKVGCQGYYIVTATKSQCSCDLPCKAAFSPSVPMKVISTDSCGKKVYSGSKRMKLSQGQKVSCAHNHDDGCCCGNVSISAVWDGQPVECNQSPHTLSLPVAYSAAASLLVDLDTVDVPSIYKQAQQLLKEK